MSYWAYFTKYFHRKLIFLFANYIKFTPNQITMISFIIGLLSAYSFLKGTWYYLIAGAILFEISFMLDFVDGGIARLKGLTSKFGMYLDTVSDFTKFLFITLCLAYGQYFLTNDKSFLFYGNLYLFFQIFFTATTYVVRFHRPESGMKKNDRYQTKYNILNNKFPSLIRLKRRLDPNNKLALVPNDSEIFAFLIAPILMNIKLGFVLGSIILFANEIILVIFMFVTRKKQFKNVIKKLREGEKGDIIETNYDRDSCL